MYMTSTDFYQATPSKLYIISRAAPYDIVEFCLQHCPRIHEIAVFNSPGTVFKVFQVSHNNHNEGLFSLSYPIGKSGNYSSNNKHNNRVKVLMKNIHFAQDTLDRLSRYLPNIKILITTEGAPFYLDQDRPIIVNKKTTSFSFVKFETLKKFALDISHFEPTDKTLLCAMVIHLIYSKEKEEAYYKFVPRDGHHYDKRYTLTTSTTINPLIQQQEENSHLINLHFHEKIEELLITDYAQDNSTVVYARFHDSELQLNDQDKDLG